MMQEQHRLADVPAASTFGRNNSVEKVSGYLDKEIKK
jgi:hypothetical protein